MPQQTAIVQHVYPWVVSSDTANNLSAIGLLVFTAPAAVQTGDIIFCIVCVAGAEHIVSVPTDFLEMSSLGTGGTIRVASYWKRVGPADLDVDNYSFGFASPQVAVGIILQVREADLVSGPAGDVTEQDGNGTTITCQAVTSSRTNGLHVVFGGRVGATTPISTPSGMSEIVEIDGNTFSLAVSQANFPGTGSTGTKTMTFATASDWIGTTVLFERYADDT